MPLQKHPSTYGEPIISGEMNTVHIGKYCSIANSVMFDGGIQHNYRFATTYPLWIIGGLENRAGMCRGDIFVGNDVWIGDGALIMSGVTIGDGAVIGARAVVTQNVAAYMIVAGTPAKVVSTRFPEKVIERFKTLQWWSWPEEKIKENSALMLSQDIEAFLSKHGV